METILSKRMLELADTQQIIGVPDDQICSPTNVKDLTESIIILMERFSSSCSGTFHVTNEGSISWFQFARLIFRTAQVSPTLINKKTDAEFLEKFLPKTTLLCSKHIQSLLFY